MEKVGEISPKKKTVRLWRAHTVSSRRFSNAGVFLRRENYSTRRAIEEIFSI